MERENIEDEHAPVDNAHVFQLVLQIFDLRGRKLGIEYDRIHAAVFAKLGELPHLSAADIGARVRRFLFLRHARVYGSARRFRKPFQLIKGRLALMRVRTLFHDGNEDYFAFFLFIK